jgi:hypothetical protein
MGQDGLAGITFANFGSNHYKNTFRQDCEKQNSMARILGGYKESEIAP